MSDQAPPHAKVNSQPPFFSDIGKETRDLLEKGFFLDHIKLDMRGLIYGPMQFASCQKCRFNDGRQVNGEWEGRYESSGFTVIPKLSTEPSLLSCELKVDRPEMEGVQIKLGSSFNPTNAGLGYSLSANYRTADYTVEVIRSNTLARINGVYNLLGWERNWAVGVGAMIDQSGGRNTLNANLVGGFQGDHYGRSVFFNYNIQQKTLTSWVHRVISAKYQISGFLTLNSNMASSAVCHSYTINDIATVKARYTLLNSVALSCILQLKPGIALTLSTEVDIWKLNEGLQKLGMGLEFA